MDQYLVYGEEYKVVRDAVAEAVVNGNVEQIEEVLEVSEFNYQMNLLQVLFTSTFPYINFSSGGTGEHQSMIE